MAWIRKDSGALVDIGKVGMSYQSGKLSLRYTNLGQESLFILGEDEVEVLLNFISRAKNLRDNAIKRQEAAERGEVSVRVQRFEDENGEPRYLVGQEIDSSKLTADGMISITDMPLSELTKLGEDLEARAREYDLRRQEVSRVQRLALQNAREEIAEILAERDALRAEVEKLKGT